MRVLLTVHQFFPNFGAGTEVLTLEVTRELTRLGHEVRIFTGYPGPINLHDKDRFDEYMFEGIHVYRFYHAFTPMGGQTSMIDLGYDSQLGAHFFNQILSEYKPDIVHFFHLNRLGSRLIDISVQMGVKCFMTPTDFSVICPTGQLLLPNGRLCGGPTSQSGNCLKHLAQVRKHWVIRKFAAILPTICADLLMTLSKKCKAPLFPQYLEVVALGRRLPVNISRLNKLNGIIAPNSFIGSLLVRYGVCPSLIDVSSYGISIPPPIPRERYTGRNKPLKIGFIGTLGFHKGCHVLIRAFKSLPDNVAILKIYGKVDEFPDYVKGLRALASNQNAIEFLGDFPNEQIAQILAEIDVLVVPSLWYENTPLVIYSAQAANCPLIISNLPGLCEAVTNDNSLKFKAGDAIDLASQVLRLINEDFLLDKLVDASIAPKPINQYVNNLLNIWLKSSEANG